MADPYIGEIKIFTYNFIPYGFLACQGQAVGIQQNQALFALIGITYGGDGRTTFNTPNLSGQTPAGVGVAPDGGTINWTLGGKHGAETVALVANQYPAHTHTIRHPTGTGSGANTYVPQPGCLMSSTSPSQFFAGPPASANTMMHPKTLEPYDGAGPSVTPHNNMQPFLVLTPAIATLGVFPQFT